MVKSNLILAAAVLCAVATACPAQPNAQRPNSGCVCPAVYRPVCGSDGRTYSNGCEANCNGRSVSRSPSKILHPRKGAFGEYRARI